MNPHDYLLEDWFVTVPADHDDDTTVEIPIGILRMFCEGVECLTHRFDQPSVSMGDWALRLARSIRSGIDG